jgi:hypothetical protein
MVGTVKHTKLETPTAQAKLKRGGSPIGSRWSPEKLLWATGARRGQRRAAGYFAGVWAGIDTPPSRWA